MVKAIPKKAVKKTAKKAKKPEVPEVVQEALKNLSKHKIGGSAVGAKKEPVTKFISPEDLWVQTRRGGRAKVVILSHEAIERLAKVGEVLITDTQLVISPKASNEQQHAFLITASGPGGVTTQIGEASNRNTHGVSRRYLATMAYKRGYDRSVLRALQIEGVYSSSETDEFLEEEISARVTNEELAAMQEDLAAVNKAATREELVKAIQVTAKKELSKPQKVYMSRVFARKYAALTLKLE